MHRRLLYLLSDDSGQDLIEYALLATFIALAGVAGFIAISDALGDTYVDGNDAVYDLWEVPAP